MRYLTTESQNVLLHISLIGLIISTGINLFASAFSLNTVQEPQSDKDWKFSKPRCGRSQSAPSATFFLFTNSNNTDGNEVNYMDAKSINESGYHKDGLWKVLIHGFLQHRDSYFPRVVKDAYLERMRTHPRLKYNILEVHWGNKNCSSIVNRLDELLSFNIYADCTTNVALQLAYMLEFLLKEKVIRSTEDIHLVGFSLGAHVAGQAGRNLTDLTGYKIGRITGLDPAGPSAPWWNIFQKHHTDLSQLDANFVDVIHTSDLFGIKGRLGHVDFYLNGGTDQPGCMPDPADYIIPDFLQVCSHNFAVDVFSKTVLDNSVKGCACGPKTYWNYLKYLVGWCTCEDQAVVGEFIDPKSTGGEYFVTTPYEEINWRKYTKSIDSSELAKSNSRVLSILEFLCIV